MVIEKACALQRDGLHPFVKHLLEWLSLFCTYDTLTVVYRIAALPKNTDHQRGVLVR